jgi:hypothetical protein
MRLFKIFLLGVVLLTFVSCGTRVLFKKKEPLQNAALVYIYVKDDISEDDDLSTSVYKIYINNKRTEGELKSNEYMSFNLKPQKIKFSATRTQVEESSISLNLEVGHIYYLKIESLEDKTFELVEVQHDIALNEIKTTGLSGSTAIEVDNILTELVETDKKESVEVVAKPKAQQKAQQNTIVTQQQVTTPSYQAPTVAPVSTSTMSKTDEIMKAYSLKEKGIISDDEFKALKSDILKK